MNRDQIVQKVKTLGLPNGSFIVFGSGPIAAVGLRQAQDIDLLVSEEVFSNLEKSGWKIVIKGPKDNPLVQGDFEAHKNWNFTAYKPTLEHLLSTAKIIDGVPFASLQEVRKWKAASGRPKDLIDVKLIDEYLANH